MTGWRACGMLTFHLHRWNELKVIPLACNSGTKMYVPMHPFRLQSGDMQFRFKFSSVLDLYKNGMHLIVVCDCETAQNSYIDDICTICLLQNGKLLDNSLIRQLADCQHNNNNNNPICKAPECQKTSVALDWTTRGLDISRVPPATLRA